MENNYEIKKVTFTFKDEMVKVPPDIDSDSFDGHHSCSLTDTKNKYSFTFSYFFNEKDKTALDIYFCGDEYEKFQDSTNLIRNQTEYQAFSKFYEVEIQNNSSYTVSCVIYGIPTTVYPNEKLMFKNSNPYIVDEYGNEDEINEEILKIKKSNVTNEKTMENLSSDYDENCVFDVKKFGYKALIEESQFLSNFFVNPNKKYSKKEYQRLLETLNDSYRIPIEIIDVFLGPERFKNFVRDNDFEELFLSEVDNSSSAFKYIFSCVFDNLDENLPSYVCDKIEKAYNTNDFHNTLDEEINLFFIIGQIVSAIFGKFDDNSLLKNNSKTVTRLKNIVKHLLNSESTDEYYKNINNYEDCPLWRYSFDLKHLFFDISELDFCSEFKYVNTNDGKFKYFLRFKKRDENSNSDFLEINSSPDYSIQLVTDWLPNRVMSAIMDINEPEDMQKLTSIGTIKNS